QILGPGDRPLIAGPVEAVEPSRQQREVDPADPGQVGSRESVQGVADRQVDGRTSRDGSSEPGQVALCQVSRGWTEDQAVLLDRPGNQVEVEASALEQQIG